MRELDDSWSIDSLGCSMNIVHTSRSPCNEMTKKERENDFNDCDLVEELLDLRPTIVPPCRSDVRRPIFFATECLSV